MVSTSPITHVAEADSLANSPATAEGFASFEAAYVHNLRDIFVAGQPNSARGTHCSERLGVMFTVNEPRKRWISLPARKMNPVFCCAEFLWYVLGRDDLAFLAHYAPSVAKYSFDGEHLTGTAYGPRIFDDHNGRSQWQKAADTLIEDPHTKRSFALIARPDEDRSLANPDVACTLALQFLLREGRLHAVAYMRSNDAFRGVVSDVFSFTMLQELMASQLNVELGTYIHVAGSYQLYDTDRDWAHKVIVQASLQSFSKDEDTFSGMIPMPPGDNQAYISIVARAEEELRVQNFPMQRADVVALKLPNFWEMIVTMFALHRCVHRGEGDREGLLQSLPTMEQKLMRHWCASKCLSK